MAVSKPIDSEWDKLFDYQLPKFFSDDEKSTFINLVEKCKVALKYLHKGNHEKFWAFLANIVSNEIEFRTIILELNRKNNQTEGPSEKISENVIWKFGLYNHARIILLQELSNFLTEEFEKARAYKKTNPYIAKNIINKANELSTFYIQSVKSLSELDRDEDDNIIEHCLYVIEDSIEIGRSGLKNIQYT